MVLMNLTASELTTLTGMYNALNKAYNMNPDNDLTEVSDDEVMGKIIGVFDNEEAYVAWGMEELGLEAIECEQSFNEGQTQAEAISEIFEQSRMILTYNVGDKVVRVGNQLIDLVKWG
jgi:hypothetical protein